MNLGLTQELKLQQKLIMTQELRQSIQILQYSTVELVEFLSMQSELNPLLEIDSFGSTIQYISEPAAPNERRDDFGNLYHKTYDRDTEFVNYEKFTSYENTLYDILYEQLYMSDVSKSMQAILSYLIENIDSKGYLSKDYDYELLQNGWNKIDIENAVKILQTFEPVGIASRNLAECLEIQLLRTENYPREALEIIKNDLVLVSSNRLDKIAKKYDIPIIKAQEICDLIKTFEPKPGSSFRSDRLSTKYVVPDIFLEKNDDSIELRLNTDILPKISFNETYVKLIEDKTDDTTFEFLNDKYKSALNIVKGINQRESTLLKIAEAIVQFQSDFFYHKKPLRPMTLKDIADMTDFHESTISRGVNHKYIQTEHGVFELKKYFTTAVRTTEGEISNHQIKNLIDEYIKNENPKRPLSDQKIADLLKTRGIEISRRTVAKYRDELNISASSKRRRY